MVRPFRQTDTSPAWIRREFREVYRQLREDRAAKRLRASSIETGTLTLSGDSLLDVQSAIKVPPGSIETSWLQAPTAPGYISSTATGFGLGTVAASVLSTTVTAPTGFASCVISLTGRVYAANNTASPVALYGQVQVDEVTGTALPVPLGASGGGADYGVSVATFATVMADLTAGEQFVVRLSAWSTAALASAAGNTADLAGSVVWFST